MPTLYLNRRSSSLSREGEHLLIKQHAVGETSQVLPLHELSSVVVVGEPSITFPALSVLINRQIPVTFLTCGGKWRGTLETCAEHYGERRRKQLFASENNAFLLVLSKALLTAKCCNARRAIGRLFSNRPGFQWKTTEDVAHFQQLRWIAEHISECTTLSALRGMEGLAAMHYFALLRHFFPKEAGFHGRQRHPSRDPANALLSWTYTLVVSACVTAIRAHGLDPAIGFLHQNANRSPALALDLVEPFRPALADLLTLHLLNHHVLKPAVHFNTLPSGVVLLNEEGRARFFSAYESALMRPFKSSVSGEITTFREAIEQQVRDFIHLLEAPSALQHSPKFFRLS